MTALPRIFIEPSRSLQQEFMPRKGLEVRLAASPAEIDAAQALRYRVFYEEMGAHPSPRAATERRDRDSFDNHCDHLLIIDHERGNGSDAVIATYRLLRSYRTGAIMQLMWRGIADYVLRHEITLLFGCASLPGTEIEKLGPALGYLHQNHLAPPSLRARALPDRYVKMDLLSVDKIDTEVAVAQVYARSAVAALPPLVKGYLRIGGFVGDGAVIDHQFDTTDVCIVVVTDGVTDKYFNHFLRRGHSR